jgi:hypothetical protein
MLTEETRFRQAGAYFKYLPNGRTSRTSTPSNRTLRCKDSSSKSEAAKRLAAAVGRVCPAKKYAHRNERGQQQMKTNTGQWTASNPGHLDAADELFIPPLTPADMRCDQQGTSQAICFDS